jgi:phospholipid transport system substrate-binding protein
MLTSLLVATLLSAGHPGPTAVVRTGNDQVQKLLANKDVSVAQLATKADEFVDFVELAKRALGGEWDKLDPKQREDFSTTMKELLRASYAQKALGQGQAQTEYGKEKVRDNEAEVHTTLLIQKDRFPVVYKLYRLSADSEWRIFDVVTDEVSLLETYRGQFRKLIAQRGYEGLLETLKRKRDQLEKKSAQTLR